MKHVITSKKIRDFANFLREEEKSVHTITKYLHDVTVFVKQTGGGEIDKKTVIEYKKWLIKNYKPRSVNSMVASLNALFRFLGWDELRARSVPVQKAAFCPKEKEISKEEYGRLVDAARQKANTRLCLILQTIASTGIRVGELPYITVEAVMSGGTTVSFKNKVRSIFISGDLQGQLQKYIGRRGVTTGPVFVTRSGEPINRSNVWREMKSLSDAAGVDPRKVFPHNLRHLFAVEYYKAEKDISKLADLLGHSNIETTRAYLVSSGMEHQRTIERMRLVLRDNPENVNLRRDRRRTT